MEKVAIEVMQANKIVELFQTMVIMSLNMGNLNMEVNNLENKLAIEEKEKATLLFGLMSFKLTSIRHLVKEFL
jgi:uncharacterized protein (UPF0548 family)